jgi:hypothetical protein
MKERRREVLHALRKLLCGLALAAYLGRSRQADKQTGNKKKYEMK